MLDRLITVSYTHLDVYKRQAYAWICKVKLYSVDLSLLLIIVMGCVGTLLFFLSLSGFLLKGAQLWKGFYYRHLNMFVLRQLTSKLGTTFGSMAMVCLMLFLTIGAMGSALGLSLIHISLMSAQKWQSRTSA